ncbi:hypothetical protein ACFSX5_19510 [Devosia albogilva]|uniref:Uncharacterized protein n=1 Tax=Devosia albogilva TaxID=429726 RepID=A0ABW5QQF9_9HYPH
MFRMIFNEIQVDFNCFGYFCAARLWQEYKITPENLNVAHVNQFYHQVIHISGGKVIDKHKPLNTDIPKDLGVEVRPVDDLDGYNRIEIKELQGIKVHLQFISQLGFTLAGTLK